MISIASTYFNRRPQFLNTLKSLQNSVVKDFEMIVVDDCSDEEHRIDDLPAQFPFLKVFRIEKQNKTYKNPCIPFNLAFSKCSGDKIVIQNSECLHVDDILDFVDKNINDSDYFVFGVYSLDERLSKAIVDVSNLRNSINFIACGAITNGQNGWYNHGIHRPHALHFCSAISRKNLKELNGFDERYAEGSCFDDNEFLHRIRVKGLNVKFIDDKVALHQFHKNFNYEVKGIHLLEARNEHLYRNGTLKENCFVAKNEKPIFPIKIIGFTQLRNELSKGNLENWFRQMSVCDKIYIFDQNSNDGSIEFYKKQKNVIVIESPVNRFKEELICKGELLSLVQQNEKDADWILWLDGDLLLDGRLLKNDGAHLKDLCWAATRLDADALFFNHFNLWRSDVYYRTDDNYHSLNGNWCPLWKNGRDIYFPKSIGLHQRQYPEGLKKGLRTNFSVVHRGFATDYQIITKYDTYKQNGQNGWDLERLLNENGLTVELVDKELIPEWFQIQDSESPLNKKKIIDVYAGK